MNLRVKFPRRARTAGLVLAALALPVVLAAATWTMTGSSFGGTVGVDDRGQPVPAVEVRTTAPSTTTRPAPPATTARPAPAGDDCAEAEEADDDDDRCEAGSGGSGGSSDDDGRGRGRNRGHGGDD